MHLPPVVFSDGADFFDELGSKYKTHDKGLFILAPSGAGKTHFCQGQSEPDWIDGDELWLSSKAQPEGPWWTQGIEVINRVDQRSEVITMEAKLKGFWVMGASNYWLKPDAIVIPDWETHREYIRKREQENYDGGATSEALEQVIEHMQTITKWHTEHGVPKFESIDAAVSALT